MKGALKRRRFCNVLYHQRKLMVSWESLLNSIHIHTFRTIDYGGENYMKCQKTDVLHCQENKSVNRIDTALFSDAVSIIFLDNSVVFSMY